MTSRLTFRPVKDDPEARIDQTQGRLVGDPAEFLMFGNAQGRVDREIGFATQACRQVVTGDLATSIRRRLNMAIPPIKPEIAKSRFLDHLASGRIQWYLACFHFALGKVPIGITA